MAKKWIALFFILATTVSVAQETKPATPTEKKLTEVQEAQQSVIELSQALVMKEDRIGELEMQIGELRRQLAKANAARLQPVVSKFVQDAAKQLGIAPEDYDPATRKAKVKNP